MRNPTTLRAWGTLGLLLVAASASAAGRTPEATVRAFFDWDLRVYHGGVPTPESLAPIRALLAPDLIDLLVRANTTERACVRAVNALALRRGEIIKPATLEGEILTGFDEDPTQVLSYFPETPGRDTASVRVMLRYTSRRRTWDPPMDWEVVVELKSHRGAWVIHDIRFLDGSLATTLRDYVAGGC